MATILVVDDDSNSRLLAAALLEPAGHTVIQAAGAGDAYARLSEYRVDLILTDLSLPVTPGAAFIRELRSDPEYESTPIVLYTGSTAHDVIDDFMRIYRISGLIQKPADPYGFVNSIESVLSAPS